MQNHIVAPAGASLLGGKRKRETAAQRLARAAQAAADVRAYDTNPDVIAYRIERMRTRVDRLIWTGLILGLLFTMANVQAFAAEGETEYSIAWWIAWLLDPMVSLVLVGVLLGEQVIARHQIVAGAWVRRTKWTALTLTYAMNTWASWAALNPSAILLHSVPPIMVFCAAEAVTTLRHQITQAVHKAYRIAVEAAPVDTEPVTPPADEAPPAVTAEDGERAMEEIRTWIRGGSSPALKPITFANGSASPRVTAALPRTVTTTIADDPDFMVTNLVTDVDTSDVPESNRGGDHDDDRTADRDKVDELLNRKAEEWIRRQCRGENGVGRRPTQREVGDQFDRSHGWGRNRIKSVQERMTAQGYVFQEDGTVLSPRKAVTTATPN
ncbi:hypothetical protein [Planobispora rosea]|uniref:hypothetical protein n=1 Tax=Planobispora rosea TaxID=35762 RepID=UPI00083A743E|nr:hypothetical protein [Planobispora rosea]